MSHRVQMELRANAAAVKRARDALAKLGDSADPQALDDARLLVSELVTNSVRHGELEPGDTVLLTAEVDTRAIRVEVCNAGHGFTHRERAPGPDQALGFGLYLVERMASRWGIEDRDATRVWFEIDLPG
jgi:anti-sigma regulatory factor (Ser/Thr protein kinase)